jgi:uncharacterized protein (TIGR00251 family)
MRITIRVKTKSGRSEIVKDGEKYLAYLKSEPEKGKANLELVKVARKYFKKEVRIKSGLTSKTKILEIK